MEISATGPSRQGPRAQGDRPDVPRAPAGAALRRHARERTRRCPPLLPKASTAAGAPMKPPGPRGIGSSSGVSQIPKRNAPPDERRHGGADPERLIGSAVKGPEQRPGCEREPEALAACFQGIHAPGKASRSPLPHSPDQPRPSAATSSEVVLTGGFELRRDQIHLLSRLDVDRAYPLLSKVNGDGCVT